MWNARSHHVSAKPGGGHVAARPATGDLLRRDAHQMVRDQVFRPAAPEPAQTGQDAPLVRDRRREHDVECAEPIGRDEQELVVLTKTEHGLERQVVTDVAFVPMTGQAEAPRRGDGP